MDLAAAARVLDHAAGERVFSAVSAEIGSRAGPLWTFTGGSLSWEAGAPSVGTDTIFDLASLTKVLATTTMAMKLVADRRLLLDLPVSEVIPEWRGADRQSVLIRDLLEHSSGLPAHREYFRSVSGREGFQRAIAEEPLEYSPRTASIYSDLGFILLGFVLEDQSQEPLDAHFQRWCQEAGIRDPLAYSPPHACSSTVAITGRDDWRGRVLQGEVHDGNAAALGGVAAHAGLFGTAAAVGDVARWWLTRLTASTTFVTPSTVPGSSRALGWDTMRPTSSCGTRMSAQAIGHTGHTGTSLWIDPAQDLYFVLLTNRVIASGDAEAIQRVRRAFHDAAIDELQPMIPAQALT